jgi:hypothetical protein
VRTRHRIEGLIALALAATLSSPAASAARGARPPRATQCLSGESVLYSGRYTRAVASVCLAGDRVHYRYGPLGHPAIDVVSAEDWSNIHHGWITGGGGGYQRHVRFTVGTENYVVFEGMYGDATDLPGQKWSGIYVGPTIQDGHARDCLDRAFIAESWTDTLVQHAPPGRRDDSTFEEVRGGPWDGWF